MSEQQTTARGPSEPPERAYRIVVALDLSDLSDRALEQALALSTHHPKAHLHILTVGSVHGKAITLPDGESSDHAAEEIKEHVLEEIEEYKQNHGPIRLAGVGVYVGVGKPAERIVALSQAVDADVIVMGTHSRHGVSRILSGSVAEEVVRTAHCGVYIIHQNSRRPPERSFPPPALELDIDIES